MTMADAVDAYLRDLEHRKRRPAKPSTMATFNAYRKRIIACVGSAPLAQFNNGAMRSFVAALSREKLSAKTIHEIVGLTKSAIASIADADTGECLHPRTWRTQFLDLPELKSQRQPTVTEKELGSAIASAFEAGHKLDAVLWALAAGTGARIGELRAVRVGPLPDVSAWNPADASLTIRASMWRNIEQAPKTDAGHRTIELALELNDLLKAFVVERNAKPGDFLFAKTNGKAADVTTLRDHLNKYLPGKGFHSLRRFRARHLRSHSVPEEITKYLLGHSNKEITSRYSQLGSDVERRRKEVSRVGLGFHLPETKSKGVPA
jgi:integrase